MSTAKIREAVGVFQDIASLRNAADALMTAGFDRSNLSVLASHHAVEQGLGHMYDKVSEVEDDPFVPTRAYYGPDSLVEGAAAIIGVLAFFGAVAGAVPVFAEGGDMLDGILGATAGAAVGGAIGGVCAYLIRKRYRDTLQEQLEHGGIPLWVRTIDAGREEKARAILEAAGAQDVHIHDRPAVEDTGVVYGYLHWLSGIHKPPIRHRRVLG